MITDKPIWLEGMFLTPQVFQQQDRYVERLIAERSWLLNPFFWGITKLKFDEQMLELGRFSITNCAGIFPDGTSFNIPDRDNVPAPLIIPIGTSNTLIYLSLALRQSAVPEIDIDNEELGLKHRYKSETILIKDCNQGYIQENKVKIAKLSLSLKLENSMKDEVSGIGVARIFESCSNHKVRLDNDYIPPCLNVLSIKNLSNYMSEIMAIMQHRGDMLVKKMANTMSGGRAEITDFMLLQIFNKYELLLKDYSETTSLHPSILYRSLIQLVGELATFTSVDRRPKNIPIYSHNNLSDTFNFLIQELREALTMVLEETVVMLKLEKNELGIWISQVNEKDFFEKSLFILAVKTSKSAEDIRSDFPMMTKVAPVEDIKNLISRALPGINLIAIPVGTHQIPHRADFIYFSLDIHSSLWAKLSQSAAIAIHVGGEFPDLIMELWMIKDKYHD